MSSPPPVPPLMPPSARRSLSSVEAMLGQVTVERDGLPAGTAVGSFVLREVIERDEYGLVYRANASASESEVLIEEYWPSALAQRNADGELVVRDQSLAGLFASGLEAFVAEAEQLAQINHPALVRLGPVWRVRNTAYRIRFERPGQPLPEYLDEQRQPPSEAWLRNLTSALLGALEQVHATERIHGHVRPERILLQPDGAPLLMDFGAARTVISRAAPWLVGRQDPGYSAPEMELYGVVPSPAADLYAVAAVLYFCVFGEPPAPIRAPVTGGVDRPTGQALIGRLQEVQRRFPSLSYTRGWAAAIERALAFDPAQRPSTVAEFRDDLARDPTPIQAPVSTAPSPSIKPAEAAAPVEPPPGAAREAAARAGAASSIPTLTQEASAEPITPAARPVVEPAAKIVAPADEPDELPPKELKTAPSPIHSRAAASQHPTPDSLHADRPGEPALSEPALSDERPTLLLDDDEPEPMWHLPINSDNSAGAGPGLSAGISAGMTAMRTDEPGFAPMTLTPPAPGAGLATWSMPPALQSAIQAAQSPPSANEPPAAKAPSRAAAPIKPRPWPWPWVLGGVVIGAIAMLVVNLGIGRLADDARLARLMAAATPQPTGAADPAASGAASGVGLGADAGPASSTPAGPGKATAPTTPAAPPTASKSNPAPARTAPPAATASPTPAPATASPPPVTATEAEPPIEKTAPEAANPPPLPEPRSPAVAPATAPTQRRLPLAQTDPNVACAPRTNFALFQCVKTQCQETAFYAHPTCVVLRRTDELPAAPSTEPAAAETAASAP